MRESLIKLLNSYLMLFPEEAERQKLLIEYLDSHKDNELVNWNNFDGHIVAGGFIYAKEENKFLVLYHNDLKMFLYPGGHVDSSDVNTLSAAKREILEETGLDHLEQLKMLVITKFSDNLKNLKLTARNLMQVLKIQWVGTK